MKLPITWLKKYSDLKLTPEKLAEALTMSGTAVESVHEDNGQAVLTIEVTTNRPDCLSILGLAREISALTGEKINFSFLDFSSKTAGKTVSKHLPKPKIKIEDKKGCPYYTARLIYGVAIAPSPAEAQNFLTLMKSRPINNVVDATNYALFEIGQPPHAFDFDKIVGGQIIVRRSKDGEKFIGIDGVEYTLDSKTLIIADAEKPIAIAGVMGGKLTEVTEQTKNLLIESAYFDPALVREASRKYKLTTESSYRFERGVCPDFVALGSNRTTDLICEWAGGQADGGLLELNYLPKKRDRLVTIKFADIDALLGLKISKARIKTILKDLGFTCRAGGSDDLEIIPPPWRRDVLLGADIAEEILRIEGFEQVPCQLPSNFSPLEALEDKKSKGLVSIKTFLAHQGFHEIITYSLLSGKEIADSGFEDLKKISKIRNFVSSEQEYLRPSLLPGMLGRIVYNLHRKAAMLKFFEIGNIFSENREKVFVGMAVCGRTEEHWQSIEEATYFYLKGAVENLLAFLKINDYQWEEIAKEALYDNLGQLKVNGKTIGTLGSVSGKVLKSWDISKEVYFFEMMLGDIAAQAVAGLSLKVKAIPKYPSVRRDIAFIIDASIPAAHCISVMTEAGAPFIKEALLFDEYTGKNISPGKRSLAFSLSYQKDSGTFTDEEVLSLQTKVCEALKEKYQVEFR